jgi:hypothetical protein
MLASPLREKYIDQARDGVFADEDDLPCIIVTEKSITKV